MPFDPSKDEKLKEWKSEETGLVVSINSYNNGEPKVQIGPRMVQTKTGGERATKAGRLTMEDMMWLYDVIDEIKEEMVNLSPPE